MIIKTNRFIFIFTIISLTVIVLLLLELQRSTREEVIERFRVQQLIGVQLLAKGEVGVEHFLKDRTSEVEFLSSLPSIRSRNNQLMDAELSKFLELIQKHHVKAISVFDEKGTIIYSTHRNAIGRNYSESDFFHWAEKKENKGRQYICCFIRKKDNKSGELPYFRLIILQPLYLEEEDQSLQKAASKFAGILSMTVDLEEVLTSLLPQITPFADKENTWIMDSNGTVLYQSEHPEMVIRNINKRDETCLTCHISFAHIDTILSQPRGTIVYQLKGRPKKIASYSSIEFSNISWKVVLNLPYKEVSGFIDRHLILTLILIGIIALTLISAFILLFRGYRLKARAEEEAKQLREKQALESKIQLILETAGEGIFGLDADGKHIFINPAAAKMLGYEVHELVEEDSHLTWHYARPDRTPFPKEECPVYETLRDGKPHYGEDYYWRKDGSGFPVEFFSTPVHENDKITGAVVTFFDITERKRSMDELRRRNRELSALYTIDKAVNQTLRLKEVLRIAVEKTLEVLDADCGGIYLLQEDGKTMELVLHQGLSGEFVKNTKKIQLGEGISGRAAAERKPVFLDISGYPSPRLLPFILREGVKSMVSVPLLIKDNVSGAMNIGSRKPDAFSEVGMNTLLSIGIQVGVAIENAKLYQDLLTTKKRAEESDRLKTAFLQNISHEIRTPMNAIIGFSGFLNEPDLIPEKRTLFIEKIQNSSHNLLSIITNIINIATVETGQEKIYKSETNLNKVMQDTWSQLAWKAREKKLQFEGKAPLPDRNAMIYTDTDKLVQILLNLVGNAIKFTHQGHVFFGYRLKGDLLEFYTEDTGIGIPAHEQQTIFDRFRQGNDTIAATYGGTGLGLSIAKAYAELLGGSIRVESEPGKGSVFYFTLPYQPVHGTTSTQTGNKIETADEKYLSGKTILIAEDEPDNFELVQLFLSELNPNVLHAKNGKETVEICKNHPEIDLVIMDIKMPLLDGYDATRQIKAFRAGLPIIAQTAYALVNDRDKALAAGCDDYIPKPVAKEQLIELIRKYL